MKIRLICVGKPRADGVAAAIAEYEARAARYWPLEVTEVRAESGAHRSPAEVRAREGERLLGRAAGAIVALDERGDRLASEDFARLLQGAREGGSDLSFVIGGAFGLDETVRRGARRLLAVAPWTVSHELARLILAEQLYRAGTIVRGEPYHK